MSKNYICFKTKKQVFDWDNSKEIPPESKRLMRLIKSRQLSFYPEWEGFEMINNRLKTPTGQMVTPQEVLAGLALLDIQSPIELQTTSKLVKHVRAIASAK